MNKNKHIPEIGKIYGQWTVISEEIKRHSFKQNRTAYFKVRCKCGKEAWRSAHNLETGKTKACKSCCKTANNTNSFIEHYFTKVKNRAKQCKFEMNLDYDYLEKLYYDQDKKCALSGEIIEFKPNYKIHSQTISLDRIDNTKGYIKGNVQWVHKDVNFMKGKLSQERFLELCKLISSKCS